MLVVSSKLISEDNVLVLMHPFLGNRLVQQLCLTRLPGLQTIPLPRVLNSVVSSDSLLLVLRLDQICKIVSTTNFGK